MAVKVQIPAPLRSLRSLFPSSLTAIAVKTLRPRLLGSQQALVHQ